MNILITGAGGFIGSYLSSTLSADHNVIAADRKLLDLSCSATVDNFFTNHKIDLVIHCALTGRNNTSEVDPKWATDSLWMWRNLYNNRHRFGKLVQFASAYELDLTKENKLITFDNILESFPQSSYGFAKNLMARSALDADNFYNFRLFGNFHHTETANRFFKKLAVADHFIIDKNRVMDYFWLEDIVPAITALINNQIIVKDINLVYAKKYSMYELASIFCGVNKLSTVIEVASDAPELTGSSYNIDMIGLNLAGVEYGFEKYRI